VVMGTVPPADRANKARVRSTKRLLGQQSSCQVNKGSWQADDTH
jgi:hypothetical protein